MKIWLRVMSVLLTIGCALTFVACADEQLPFLQLSDVPTFTVTPTSETVRRYNTDFTDTFVPSEDYGTLVPFVGDIYDYTSVDESSEEQITAPIYGLCTLSGAIVVDPVYNGIITHDLKGGTLYELITGAVDPSFAEKRLLIPSDGSWMMELTAKESVSKVSGAECFIVERQKTVRRNKKKVTLTYYDFYSYDSKSLFTFDKKLSEAENTTFVLGDFCDSLAAVNVAVTTETTEKGQDGKDVIVKSVENYGYFINTEGEQAFKNQEYSKVEDFCDGLAVVCDKEGLYGILKADGEFLFEPQFKVINRNATEGYFACGMQGYFIIVNNNGDTVSKVSCENADISVLGTDRIIYKKTLKFTGKTEFFSCVTGGAFVCTETGQFPDPESGEYGLFTCSYSGVTDVFLSDGNSIAQFNNFGHIAGVWGKYAVIVSKNGDKTAILDIENGIKTDWIDAEFSGEVFDNGKYVVLNNGGKYSLYNVETPAWELENCEFIKVIAVNDVMRLNAVCDGFVSLYGPAMDVLMRYQSQTEVARR